MTPADSPRGALVRAGLGVVALALMPGVVACTQTPAHAPASIVGGSFSEVEGVLPDSAALLIQDVSVEFGLEPTYTQDQFGSSRWTVLAACSDAESLEQSSTIEIAVAPADAVDEQDRQAARDGAFSDAVTCSF